MLSVMKFHMSSNPHFILGSELGIGGNLNTQKKKKKSWFLAVQKTLEMVLQLLCFSLRVVVLAKGLWFALKGSL
jgi:hypothetical protein